MGCCYYICALYQNNHLLYFPPFISKKLCFSPCFGAFKNYSLNMMRLYATKQINDNYSLCLYIIEEVAVTIIPIFFFGKHLVRNHWTQKVVVYVNLKLMQLKCHAQYCFMVNGNFTFFHMHYIYQTNWVLFVEIFMVCENLLWYVNKQANPYVHICIKRRQSVTFSQRSYSVKYLSDLKNAYFFHFLLSIILFFL